MTDRGEAGANRRWWWAVIALTALGLAIRVAFVAVRWHWPAHGDAYFYHSEANLLVEGKGWINPFLYYGPSHARVATAAFPPLFTLVLAACSLVGLKSFVAHRLWCCVIGAGAVVLGGAVGRDLGGRRVGLITAGILAVYPNLWMSNGLGMSETLSPILALAVLWAAYRMWRQPSVGQAVLLGAALGLAAVGRDEMALLAPLLLLPLALGRVRGWGRRLRVLGTGVIAAGVLVAPVVGYNMSRFAKPVYISDGLGVTLASADCPATWQGTFAGYWDIQCSLAADTDPGADEAVQGAHEQHVAVSYIKHHLGGLPRISAIRLGRAFGFYRPAQQMQFDKFFDGRPLVWAWTGLVMYYGLLLLAVPGIRAMRRAGLPVWPLAAVAIDVVVSVLLTFGQTRYRETLEPVLVLLGAFALDRLFARRPGQPAAAPLEGVIAGAASEDGRDVLVVIPAYNEERSVGDVVQQVAAAVPRADILVVDDGSGDATGVLARAAGAEVATAPFNLGVGGAMRIGFRYAAEHGHQAVVQVDADGQHDPRDIARLLAVLEGGERPHVVIGSRFANEAEATPGAGVDREGAMAVPRLRRLAMRALAAYATAQTGTRLDDVTSGFRAHNRPALELFARTYPAEYLSDTVESLVIAQRAGGRFSQVGVTMRQRTSGAPSQSTLRSASYLLRVTLILVLATVRRQPGQGSKRSPHSEKGEAWPVSI